MLRIATKKKFLQTQNDFTEMWWSHQLDKLFSSRRFLAGSEKADLQNRSSGNFFPGPDGQSALGDAGGLADFRKMGPDELSHAALLRLGLKLSHYITKQIMSKALTGKIPLTWGLGYRPLK